MAGLNSCHIWQPRANIVLPNIVLKALQFIDIYIPSPQVRESKTVLDSGLQALDSRFQLLDSSLCQWYLDSGFQSSLGFQILLSRIPDSRAKIPDPKTKNLLKNLTIYTPE